jgi:hypothetical protein
MLSPDSPKIVSSEFTKKLNDDLSRLKHSNSLSIWHESACRIALAGFRCFLALVTNRKATENPFDIFFSISLPISLAFFSIMIGDILALKVFKSKSIQSDVERSVLTMLNVFEAWQMISICQSEEIRPLVQLFLCILWVFVILLIPDNLRSHWLSALLIIVSMCVDVLNFKHQPSRIAVILYASATVSGAVTNSKFVKYFVHLSIILVNFYRHDCMLSGMILMVAVSRIGVAMAYDAEMSGGLPVPCIP